MRLWCMQSNSDVHCMSYIPHNVFWTVKWILHTGEKAEEFLGHNGQKEDQKPVLIQFISNGNDFAILPTAWVWQVTITYASLPLVYDKLFHAPPSVVIVITLLIAIMKEQAIMMMPFLLLRHTKSSLITFHLHKYSKWGSLDPYSARGVICKRVWWCKTNQHTYTKAHINFNSWNETFS